MKTKSPLLFPWMSFQFAQSNWRIVAVPYMLVCYWWLLKAGQKGNSKENSIIKAQTNSYSVQMLYQTLDKVLWVSLQRTQGSGADREGHCFSGLSEDKWGTSPGVRCDRHAPRMEALSHFSPRQMVEWPWANSVDFQSSGWELKRD